MSTRREHYLINFKYPAFTEESGSFCRRIRFIEGDILLTSTNEKFRMSPRTRVTFGLHEGTWPADADLFVPSDWVSLRQGSRGLVAEMELLSPCLRERATPLPSVEVIREWNVFLGAVRKFFERREFLEVQTPTLVTCPGTEPHLEAFSTHFQRGRENRKFFLPTSPELHLKKLVAAGYGPLFEIRPCFRNGEVSAHHQPEFWMLEWYRPGQTLEAIEKDCRDLVKVCAKALSVQGPERTIRCSMPELFKGHLGLTLTPRTSAEELIAKARELALHLSLPCDFDDAFYLLFLEKIEPKIDPKPLLFLRDYPPSQAALARLTNEGWGDRFEMYWRGMELANGYHELNDPVVQKERSREDLRKQKALGKEPVALDEDFFQALESGMPPTAGIALGLERLFLALTERNSLADLRLFPIQ